MAREKSEAIFLKGSRRVEVTAAAPSARGRVLIPLLVLVHFCHHLVTGILIPLLPMLRDAFSLDYFRSGLLVSSFNLVYGVAQLPMGNLADRFSKRWLLSLGLVGVALCGWGIGLGGTYGTTIVFLVLMGVAGGTYHPVASPFLAQYFPPQRRGMVLGFHLIGGSSSLLFTPVLVGLIAGQLGWQMAYLILPVPVMVVAALFVVAAGRETRGVTLPSGGKEGGPSLLEIARLIGLLVAIAVVTQLISSGVNAFLPLYFVDMHGLDKALAAMLVGLPVGAGIVAAPLGGALSDRLGRKPVILLSVVMTGPLLYLMTVIPFGFWLILVILLFGLANTMRMPVMESLIMDIVPLERRSTVMGVYFFLTMEVGGISAVVIGLLMDWLGLSAVFTGLALIALASSVLVLLLRGRA